MTPDRQLNKTVHNDRLELLATTFNGVAMATIVADAVTPLIAWTYGIPGSGGSVGGLLISAAWLGVGAGLRALARRLLGGLRE